VIRRVAVSVVCGVSFCLSLAISDPLPTVIVAPGKLLCIRLDKNSKMKVGAGATGTLAETVYVRDQIAIAVGTRFIGHVAEIYDGPKSAHIKSMMDGDFTPPHEALVQFDYVVAADGRWLPIQTKPAAGIPNEAEVDYSEDGEALVNGEPKPDRQIKQAVTDTLVHKLPYHGQHVAKGDDFHAEITAPFDVVSQGTAPAQKDGLLTLQLLTPLDTKTVLSNQPVQAVIAAPFYGPDGTLIFPEGTKVDGRVTDATSAGMLQHAGHIRIHMDSALLADGTTVPLNGEVAGIESSRGDHMKVTQEGELSTSRSKIAMIPPLAKTAGTAYGAADPEAVKTGFSRATRGLSGFGVIGSGIAQAGPGTATGFGAYGAAKSIYWTFIGPGKNVVLPVGTRVRLRLERPVESKPDQKADAAHEESR
jgi:hypothetical protein